MQRRALVRDCQMPEGVDWFIARETSGASHLFVRESLCVGDCGACPVLAEVLRLSAAGEIPAAVDERVA
jgi:hypothetical protein